ncbi:MAG: hypothetical protein IKC75_05315, partial [Clostridia bacterium]|nr:hypothetical protein [Clostridia bacterium]
MLKNPPSWRVFVLASRPAQGENLKDPNNSVAFEVLWWIFPQRRSLCKQAPAGGAKNKALRKKCFIFIQAAGLAYH